MVRPLSFVVRGARTTAAWCRAHRGAVDAIFAAIIAGLSILGAALANVSGSERDPDLLAYVLVVGAACGIAWRRSAPIAALVIVAGFTIPFWILDYSTVFDPPLLLVLYSVTAHSVDRRRAWWAAGTTLLVLTAVATVGAFIDAEDLTASQAVGVAASLSMGAVVGEIVHNRRRRVIELEERAARAEAHQLAEAQQAVAAERIRIAREMHDVVAHGMSVVVVQAAAAQRVIRSDPETAAELLNTIETVGRESLTDMRRVLGVLRQRDDEAGSLAPQPTMDDIRTVVANCNEAGIPTELVVEGNEYELSAGLGVAAFRIGQEALTNVIKHAGPAAHATVRVEYTEDTLRIEITDDGRGAAASLSSPHGGHGLIGMRERVEIYNGEFSAGPRPGGGYRVQVVFPTDGRTDYTMAVTDNNQVTEPSS